MIAGSKPIIREGCMSLAVNEYFRMFYVREASAALNCISLRVQKVPM